MPKGSDAGMDLVMETLASCHYGVSIVDISRKCGLNRNSVAKYLNILVTLGQAEMQVVGPAKVYHLSSRVPFSDEFFRRYPEPALMLDENGLVKMVNKLFLLQCEVSESELLGTSLFELRSAVIQEVVNSPELQAALHGTPIMMNQWSRFICGSKSWKYWIVPAVTGDGSFGVFISICQVDS